MGVETAPKMTTSTHCPYCAFRRGMYISDSLERAVVTNNKDLSVNNGVHCVKGDGASASGHNVATRSVVGRRRAWC